MNSTNKRNSFKKYKEMGFTFLYIFILFVTTFHHHPIDFAESKSFIKTIPSETSHYSFTIEECPIINFSQKGFNSTFTSSAFTELTFQILQQIVFGKKHIFKNWYSYSYYLRGPPSPLFI